jgi:hypothetical protein
MPTLSFSDYLSVGAILIVIVGIIAQVIAARGQAKSEGLDDAAKTVELLEKRINAQSDRITELEKSDAEKTKDILHLQELISLKDNTIKQYLEILQNRSPDLTQFIVDQRESTRIIETSLKAILQFMKDNANKPTVEIHNSPNSLSPT